MKILDINLHLLFKSFSLKIPLEMEIKEWTVWRRWEMWKVVSFISPVAFDSSDKSHSAKLKLEIISKKIISRQEVRVALLLGYHSRNLQSQRRSFRSLFQSCLSECLIFALQSELHFHQHKRIASGRKRWWVSFLFANKSE